MDGITTSLIVTGQGKLIRTSFDRPVSVHGKSMGLKSVSFPKIENSPIRYKVRVLDSSSGIVHTLSLPPYEWEWSDQIIYAIFGLFLDLYERLSSINQQTYIIDAEGDVQVTNFQKPWFKGHGLHMYASIHYADSGLTIVRGPSHTDFWSPRDNVFNLLKSSYVNSNDQRFGYTTHEIEHPEFFNEPVTTVEPVFLFCDVIKPTYINGVKRRVLDSMDMNSGGKYFTNYMVLFHEFAVDRLMHINFYFQTLDGATITFTNQVVIHLVVK